MEFSQPPISADIGFAMSFNEKTGILSVGFNGRPTVPLGTTLSYRLTPDEARDLAKALVAYAVASTV